MLMLKCLASDQVLCMPKCLSAILKFHIEVFYVIIFRSWTLQLKIFTKEKPLNDLSWNNIIISSKHFFSIKVNAFL